MVDVVWHRGVPWAQPALTAARADGVADAVTEVAREFRDTVAYDPGYRTPDGDVQIERGRFTAILDRHLVVIGHGRPDEASSSASGTQPGPSPAPAGGRGPKDYNELARWLEDEGYQVTTPPGRSSHPVVINSRGARLVTLNHTPRDTKRSLANDVATCRRVLGIPLRRNR